MQDVCQQKHHHTCIAQHLHPLLHALALQGSTAAERRQHRCAAHNAQHQRAHGERGQACASSRLVWAEVLMPENIAPTMDSA